MLDVLVRSGMIERTLENISTGKSLSCWKALQMECVDKDKFREYDSSPLEIDRLPAIILQIEDLQHLRIR